MAQTPQWSQVRPCAASGHAKEPEVRAVIQLRCQWIGFSGLVKSQSGKASWGCSWPTVNTAAFLPWAPVYLLSLIEILDRSVAHVEHKSEARLHSCEEMLMNRC